MVDCPSSKEGERRGGRGRRERENKNGVSEGGSGKKEVDVEGDEEKNLFFSIEGEEEGERGEARDVRHCMASL